MRLHGNARFSSMNKAFLLYSRSFILAIALGSAVALPAFAEDAPRFSADKFLEEWKTFLDEETKAAKKDEIPSNLDFNVGDSLQRSESEFLFFKKSEAGKKQKSPTAGESPLQENDFTPSSMFLAPGLQKPRNIADINLFEAFTPRYAVTQISFELLPVEKSNQNGSQFGLSLNTGIARSGAGKPEEKLLYQVLPSQSYSIGASIHYAGFRFDANIRAQQGANYDGFGGYDVGVSYRQQSWSTGLMFSEYRQNNNYVFGLANTPSEQSYYAIEFGAAYNLNPWLSFVGSFRWYEDAQLFWLDPNGLNSTRLFYLGTNVSF